MATEPAQSIVPEASGAPAAAEVPPAPLAPESALLKQERRMIAVRDINTKIDELEKNMSGLTAAFGQSQESIDDSLHDLQRRSTQLATDILGIVTRIDRNNRQQQEASEALENRLKGSMSQLRVQISKADEEIHAQQLRIEQLDAGQEALQSLHDALAADGRRQSAELKALTAETREQLQINRTHIEGLHALHREQKQALHGLTCDFDLLTERTNYLADQLTNLTVDVAQDRRHTGKRFRTVAWGTGLLALVIFSTMAVLQYHPTTVPARVKAQIASLAATVSAQASAQQSMNKDMQGIEGQLGSLGEHVAQQGKEIAAMQVAIDHTTTLLQKLQKSETAVNQRVSGLEQKTGIVAANGLRDGSWLASLPPGHFSIQLLGSGDASYLAGFAKSQSKALADMPVALAKSSSHGSDWYSLFCGDYASRADAVAAMRQLPEALQRNQPLVRSVDSIKGALSN